MHILNNNTIRLVFLFVLASTQLVGQFKFSSKIVVGAERTTAYLSELKGKNIALVANQSSRIGETHLVDSLLALGINIKKVFCAEHGFRGIADAGEHVESSHDSITGLPLISLYGKHKKPYKNDLQGIDMVIFDIQDVGVRFYTYTSTLHYVMDACADAGIPLMVMDRPNPNGFYVDGPVLDTNARSFVGMHPVPLVHGLTIGEYALMINGQKWLTKGQQCKLSVVACENYDHTLLYELPVKPSPNLPNIRAVLLYPSLGLFEGTVMSVGRGTDFPFQAYGHPNFMGGNFEFTPESRQGAKKPKLMGELCKGIDMRIPGIDSLITQQQINLKPLISSYISLRKQPDFFNAYFYKLAGTHILKKQIEEGFSEAEIRASWQTDLNAFKMMREKYLLYTDF